MSYESLINKIDPSLFTTLGFLLFTVPFIVITFDVYYPFYFDKSDLILYCYIFGYSFGMAVINELLHGIIFKGRSVIELENAKQKNLIIISLKYYHQIIALISVWLLMTIASKFFSIFPEYLFWVTFSVVLGGYKHIFKELTVKELRKRQRRKNRADQAKKKMDKTWADFNKSFQNTGTNKPKKND